MQFDSNDYMSRIKKAIGLDFLRMSNLSYFNAENLNQEKVCQIQNRIRRVN